MTPDNCFPLVTIGIPTYNGSKRLQKALDSVWIQQYPNLEVIISDNASSDNTPAVVERVQRMYPQVKYFRQDVNIGLIANFDFTLGQASGKYFMWLADDDTIEAGALLKSVDFMEAHPDYSLVSGWINHLEADGVGFVERDFSLESSFAPVRTMQYYFKVVYGGMFHGLMRRAAAQAVSPRFVFGNDLHFVAGMAFLGKLRNLNFSGYHKSFGGFSRDTQRCALALGESQLAARFVRVKIAVDAYREVMQSPVYAELRRPLRLGMATCCFLGALFCYYGRVYPFIAGGKIKSFLQGVTGSGLSPRTLKKVAERQAH